MRVAQINNPLIDPSVVRAPSRAPQWVIPTVKVAMVVADGLIAATSFAGAFYIREGTPVFNKLAMERSGGSRFAP